MFAESPRNISGSAFDNKNFLSPDVMVTAIEFSDLLGLSDEVHVTNRTTAVNKQITVVPAIVVLIFIVSLANAAIYAIQRYKWQSYTAAKTAVGIGENLKSPDQSVGFSGKEMS